MPAEDQRWLELKCKVCSREAGGKEFCPNHSDAHGNVLAGYEVWRKSLNIPWKDYLRNIKENPLTGIWAKEVAEHLLSNEEE